MRKALGVCNHWTGLLDSNFNALKTVFMLSDIIYLPVELHNTRTTCKQFLQPFARTSAYFNSYVVSSVRLWNALTSSIVNCNDIRT